MVIYPVDSTIQRLNIGDQVDNLIHLLKNWALKSNQGIDRKLVRSKTSQN